MEDLKSDRKVFWFDVETTGLDPDKHGIVQFSAQIEVDGTVKEKIDEKVKPDDHLQIKPEALEVCGIDRSDIRYFMPEPEFFDLLYKTLDNYVDKYDSDDKFWIGGFNVGFDMDFLGEFWERNKHNPKSYLGSYLARNKMLDPFLLYPADVFSGKRAVPENYKLETLADLEGFETEDYHDAAVDIEATRYLFYELSGMDNPISNGDEPNNMEIPF